MVARRGKPLVRVTALSAEAGQGGAPRFLRGEIMIPEGFDRMGIFDIE